MEISITRALAECKLLEKRITKKTNEYTPIIIQKGEDSIPGFGEVDKFKKYSLAEHLSIIDLTNRRMVIKRAIILSNTQTKITINEEEMSVTEAIDFKNIIILWEQLFVRLRREKASITEKYEYLMESVNERLDTLLMANLNKDKSKIKPDEMESISAPFLKRNAPKIIDPIDITGKINDLEHKINEFKLNIDFILSESNSRTLINIAD